VSGARWRASEEGRQGPLCSVQQAVVQHIDPLPPPPPCNPPPLRRTIDWYLNTSCEDYWQGDLEAALRPHPLLVGTSLTGDPTRIMN